MSIFNQNHNNAHDNNKSKYIEYLTYELCSVQGIKIETNDHTGLGNSLAILGISQSKTRMTITRFRVVLLCAVSGVFNTFCAFVLVCAVARLRIL